MNRCTSDFDSTARTSAGVCQSLTLRGIFWACVCVCVCVRLLQTTDDGAMTSERDESHSTSPLSVPLHPPNTDTRTPQRHTHTHTHTHTYTTASHSHTHTSASVTLLQISFLEAHRQHSPPHIPPQQLYRHISLFDTLLTVILPQWVINSAC